MLLDTRAFNFNLPFHFLFKIVPFPRWQVCCYLSDRLIELPGLEMNELDNHLYYRHILLTTSEQLEFHTGVNSSQWDEKAPAGSSGRIVAMSSGRATW